MLSSVKRQYLVVITRRYSPTPVRAPAPTPISPERYGHYSRTPQTRDHSTAVTSRHIKRWGTLSSVYDQDETEMSREALGSPEGEVDEIAVEPVFLTQEVLSRDPSVKQLLTTKDIEEWPQDRMIINVIENDLPPRTGRSPSPGSKTNIPQDILAEFQGDPYGRKEMRIAGKKLIGKLNVVKEPEMSTEFPTYVAPAWRPPRSRTPIQFSETPSRRAPKPLRQPPAESVPKSLTVQPLVRRVLRRPKSTPPRISSPRDSRDLPVQQILSESSLPTNMIQEGEERYSMVAQVSSPSADTCGSIPPPPSPETLLVGTLVPSVPRLDPVSEVEEKSSLASCSVVDGTSQVEGVANLSEVEEEVDISRQSQNNVTGSIEEQGQQSGFEETETEIDEQSLDVKDIQNLNLHGRTVLSSVDEEATIDKQNQLTADAVSNEITQEQTANNEEEPREELETQQEEIPIEANTTAVVPPHPPGSPDIVSTPDFTEGVDMSLDLEAELRAAMEGLDDLADAEESGDKRTSPDLEAW